MTSNKTQTFHEGRGREEVNTLSLIIFTLREVSFIWEKYDHSDVKYMTGLSSIQSDISLLFLLKIFHLIKYFQLKVIPISNKLVWYINVFCYKNNFYCTCSGSMRFQQFYCYQSFIRCKMVMFAFNRSAKWRTVEKKFPMQK